VVPTDLGLKTALGLEVIPRVREIGYSQIDVGVLIKCAGD